MENNSLAILIQKSKLNLYKGKSGEFTPLNRTVGNLLTTTNINKLKTKNVHIYFF